MCSFDSTFISLSLTFAQNGNTALMISSALSFLDEGFVSFPLAIFCIICSFSLLSIKCEELVTVNSVAEVSSEEVVLLLLSRIHT
jgi:hypothetical protein